MLLASATTSGRPSRDKLRPDLVAPGNARRIVAMRLHPFPIRSRERRHPFVRPTLLHRQAGLIATQQAKLGYDLVLSFKALAVLQLSLECLDARQQTEDGCSPAPLLRSCLFRCLVQLHVSCRRAPSDFATRDASIVPIVPRAASFGKRAPPPIAVQRQRSLPSSFRFIKPLRLERPHTSWRFCEQTAILSDRVAPDILRST